MSSEVLLIEVLDVNSGVTWNNVSNAENNSEDSTYADSSAIGDVDYGGWNQQNSAYTPDTGSTDLVYCGLRHFDRDSEHADDTFYLEFYDADAVEWVQPIPPFNSGNKLPTSLFTLDITTSVRTRFNAAANKKTFVDGFQVRLRCVKSKGDDNVIWGVAWCKLEYNYTAPIIKTFISDAYLKKEQVKTFTSDAFLCLPDTSYVDCADDDDNTMDSDAPACNAQGEDYTCSGEGSQDLTLYIDGSDSGWNVCYEDVGGTSALLEGLGADQNHGPAPIFPANGDAKKYFGKTVNIGKISYITTETDGSTVEVRFTGLSTTKKYTITFLGCRGEYNNRWTEYALSDDDGFTADHSSGVIEGGTPTGRNCRYVAGDNWTNGYVARWKDVQPGGDGDFTVTFKGVAQGVDVVNKGYLSAFIITEQQVNVATKTFTSDAYLSKQYTKTFTSDLYLYKEYLKTFTSDAWLVNQVLKTFTSDAYLFEINTKDFTSDAYLKATLLKIFTSDSFLLSGYIKFWTSDAYLLKEQIKTFTSDAHLISSKSKSFTSDAYLQQEYTKDFTSDTWLINRRLKSFTSDAWLYEVLLKTFTSDSYLYKILLKDFTSDAWLFKVNTRDFTSDAILIKVFTKDFTSDAILFEVISKTFTSDAYLFKVNTKDFTSDAILLKEQIKTFTSDAILITEGATTNYKTFTSDAILQRIQNIVYGVMSIGFGTGFTNRGIWEHKIGWPRLEVTSVDSQPKTKGSIKNNVKALGSVENNIKTKGSISYKPKAQGNISNKPKVKSD